MSVKMYVTSWLKKTIRRQHIIKQSSTETPLNRCLTLPHLIFYSVAQMVGAGIYALTGKLIRDVAGPASSISYLVAAISAIFTGLCFAEFCTIVPRAGSCYSYTYTVMGELPAFIVGWTMLSDSIIIMSSIAKAFSGTINVMAGGVIRNWTVTNVGKMSEEYVTKTSGPNTILDDSLDFVALALIIVLILLTLIGNKVSFGFIGVITIIQLCLLIAITVACFVYGSFDNWSVKPGGFFPFGFEGIMNGAGIAVFAFNGFDCLANASEEAKDPRRSIPIALFVSLAIVTVFYVTSTLGISYLIPRILIDYSSPFAMGFQNVGVTPFYWVAAVATLLATGAAKISQMYIIPRLLYSMASDGLLFKWMAYISPCNKVPVYSLLLGGSIAGLLALLIRMEIIVEMSSIGILISYIMIGFDLIILKYLHIIDGDLNIKIQKKDKDAEKYATLENEDDESQKSSRATAVALVNMGSMTLRKFAMKIGEKYPVMKFKSTFLILGLVHMVCILFFSLVVAFIVSYDGDVEWSFFVITLFLVMGTFGLLCIYEPKTTEGAFETPFMPLAPIMTILINFILILKISAITWLRFVVWTVLGLLIYVFYGMSHSTAGSAPISCSEHNLRQARDYGATKEEDREYSKTEESYH